MKNLRAHIHGLQVLEAQAAEKAGMRFALLDEGALLGRDSAAYLGDYVDQLLKDIAPEIEAAAKLGRVLHDELTK